MHKSPFHGNGNCRIESLQPYGLYIMEAASLKILLSEYKRLEQTLEGNSPNSLKILRIHNLGFVCNSEGFDYGVQKVKLFTCQNTLKILPSHLTLCLWFHIRYEDDAFAIYVLAIAQTSILLHTIFSLLN